ncbi:hypothetical protein FRC07_009926 [Ceratobasidium sp. 392]|nr:hypothetical protein FRC07_009926 [Ceratobasidium sp. 392]
MPVRINEADETSYEHVLDLWNWRMRCEGPFNAKDMQAQRQRTVLENGAWADGGAVGGMVGGEGAIFAYVPWDDPETRVAWHIEESEDAGPLPHAGPVPCNPKIDQREPRRGRDGPGVTWASQLVRERNVCVQVEAVWAFGGGRNESRTNGLASDLGRGSGTFPRPYLTFASNPPSGAVNTTLAQTDLDALALGDFAGKVEWKDSVAKREASLKERKA